MEKRQSRQRLPSSKARDNTEYVLMKGNEEFASVFNLRFGEGFVDPSTLEEVDGREIFSSFSRGKAEISTGLMRDLKKIGVLKSDGTRMFFCLENQSVADARIAVRAALYAFVQILSLMKEERELMPIVFLAICWEKDGYGRREIELREFFPSTLPEEVMRLQPSLTVPVLDIATIGEDEMEVLSPDVRATAMLLQIAFGIQGDTVDKYMEKLREMNENMGIGEKALDVVRAVTRNDMVSLREDGMNENIFDYISRKEKENLEKGIEQGIEQGMEKGIEKGMEKGEVDNCVDNVMNLSRTMNISVEKAMDAMCVRDGLREKVQERIKALA